MRSTFAGLPALVTLLILAAVPSAVAQNSATTDVALNATVVQGLTLVVSGGPLSFGSVVAGTTPAAVDAQSSSVLFTVTGNGGSQVKVDYSDVIMNGPSGATITFTPSVFGSSSSLNQSTSTDVPSGSSVNLSGASGSEGSYYLWLGGALGSIPAAQTTGSYSGTFTMTVSYQ